jgi:DNA repair exonuclease SbcCD ATPase subunit
MPVVKPHSPSEGSGGGPAKLQLPKPERFTLRAFSLYERQTQIHVDINGAGVFCLVGANGLGKSTFLAALNYAITGVVPQPQRVFRGVADYYARVQPYAARYFRGRISDEDAEAAEVELEMRVGARRYRIVRGMFEPESLRQLEITHIDGGPKGPRTTKLDDEERHRVYVENVLRDTGLETFAQLVYLQHFVLSFDERRELLFWNQRLLQAALYITFGLDPERAKRADNLTRRIEGSESRARNFQWQATNLRQQLEALEAVGKDVAGDDVAIAESHRELQSEQTDLGSVVEKLQEEVGDTQLQIAELTAQLQATRNDYDALWTKRLQGYANPAVHPVVTATIADGRCSICGTEGAEVVATVQHRLAAEVCPLCDSDVSEREGANEEDLEQRLKGLDAELTQTRTQLVAAEAAHVRVSKNLESRRKRFRKVTQELDQFEEANLRALTQASAGVGGLAAIAQRYRAQIAELHQQRDAERVKRDRARRELEPLKQELAAGYAAAEAEFVPRFQSLAREFLGLDLHIDLNVQRDSVGLVLTMEGARRRGEDTLSESQRFFVDIALRMAFAQQLTSRDAPGCLYIDTPEGSLDIAYESRAGQMFGMFVKEGFQIVMTANINTSQLLHRLAEVCGPGRIKLDRMTEWTSLTEVQAAEEDLFESAWRDIVKSAKGKK